ncbi:MATE efflux family protein [Aaosphaeria arxii CBS 175.79]|uniref:MATE efflux family protein n=1 Tax=Aaosphaeria arxii CBS 175.79 TaxID=1450172 RepID=A0A6A5Y658_9PLEO|nr:MATE efflux family protein [Aaosphaeria arxii CBS 175.79]KAF2020044.1 MATE efflux family protein [Aaosphaeria arxii CBS 175.79]
MDEDEEHREPWLAEPLLSPHDHTVKTNGYGTAVDGAGLETIGDEAGGGLVTTMGKEARLLFKYSVPCTITYLLQYSFSLVTIFVAGHIGTDELGAVSLATMTANITGYALYEGLASSLDTLCAQAYGSGRKDLVGLHFQRMIVFMLTVTLFIGAIWFNSGVILSAMVPERHLALMAGKYLRILLASCPGYAIFEAGKRFVQAQGLFNASLFVLVLSAPLNMLFNYVFVFALDWGLTGAACATVVSNTLLPIFLYIYIIFVAPEALDCWNGFSREAFSNWGPMAKLSAAGIIMVEAEWLTYDILTFSVTHISTAHLAAQSLCMTISNVMWHIPFSVSVAVSTRLGNLVGASSLRAARIATRTYVLVFFCIGLLNAGIVVLARHSLPRFFTEDPEVIAIAVSVMPAIAIFQLADAFTSLANSILRGLGRQAVGGYVNLFVYYVVAVPLSLFLCFGKPDLGLAGLWTGCVTGAWLIAGIEGAYCKMTSWKRAIEDAKERED